MCNRVTWSCYQLCRTVLSGRGCVQVYVGITGGNRGCRNIGLKGSVTQSGDTIVDLLSSLIRDVMGVETLVVTEDSLTGETPSVRDSRDERYPERLDEGRRRGRGGIR
jgi:hypothetical protein